MIEGVRHFALPSSSMPDGGSTIGFIPSVMVIVLIPIATTSIQWLDQIVVVKDTMVRGWVDFFQRPMEMDI
jgi:hypothetical protein